MYPVVEKALSIAVGLMLASAVTMAMKLPKRAHLRMLCRQLVTWFLFKPPIRLNLARRRKLVVRIRHQLTLFITMNVFWQRMLWV